MKAIYYCLNPQCAIHHVADGVWFLDPTKALCPKCSGPMKFGRDADTQGGIFQHLPGRAHIDYGIGGAAEMETLLDELEARGENV